MKHAVGAARESVDSAIERSRLVPAEAPRPSRKLSKKFGRQDSYRPNVLRIRRTTTSSRFKSCSQKVSTDQPARLNRPRTNLLRAMLRATLVDQYSELLDGAR